VDAARSVSLENLTAAKGFVVAKGDGSMTVRDGRSLFQVIATARTQIMGRRASFAGIAVDDIVRVEGLRTPNQRILATRVEVLLTAGNVLVARRSKMETDDTVTLMIW
jgi:hypothetical protein